MDGFEELEQEVEEEQLASKIAGIVTDGHNEPDQFDHIREEQLQQERLGEPEEDYGGEGSEGYGEEQAEGYGEEQAEEEEEAAEEVSEGQLDMQQIHPDLLAAAHKMGIDMNSE